MKSIIVSIILTGFILQSCGTTQNMPSPPTKRQNYPEMFRENPVSILIMPPINNTTHVEAKEYFYATLAEPLCEKGYYVISPFLAMDLLKSESAYDGELFINGSLANFRNFFGADAVLFTTIDKWAKSAIDGQITVEVEYHLKSALTNQSLFKRRGHMTVDTSIHTSSGNPLGDLIGNMLSTVLTTAMTDKIIAARSCNDEAFTDLPRGKYASANGLDGEDPAGEINFTKVIKAH